MKSEIEKRSIAQNLITEIDLLFAQATNNERNALSYQDICKITDYISEELTKQFNDFPKIIQGACILARSYLNPDKAGSKKDMKAGLGLLLSTGGGIAIVFGILSWIGASAGIFAIIVTFVMGPTVPIGGPISVALGIAAIVAGVFVAIRQKSPTELSAKAHETIISAVITWAGPPSQVQPLIGQDIAIRAHNGKYVSCDLQNGSILTASFAKNKDASECFRLMMIDGFYYIQSVANGKFVSVDRNSDGAVTAAYADSPREWERFSIFEHDSFVYILSSNGKWMMTDTRNKGRLVAQVEKPVEWEKFRLELF